MNKLKNNLPVVVLTAIMGLTLAGWLYYTYHKISDQAGVVTVAQPAKEVVGVEKTAVNVKSVEVYKGGAGLKKRLTLPQAVIDDNAKQVLAASRVPASDFDHTVTTVLDTATGKSETFIRTEPLPWVAYSTKGSAGVYYGFKNGEQAIRLQVKQEILQVKRVHIGVQASVDQTLATSKTDTFVGVGAEYRW